ncbi:hypothetical protein HBB16_03930 [Pseudonocardia sp. MCCB 268]|nr:hypothetical protein [Pseudonocardia cytotoxica]
MTSVKRDLFVAFPGDMRRAPCEIPAAGCKYGVEMFDGNVRAFAGACRRRPRLAAPAARRDRPSLVSLHWRELQSTRRSCPTSCTGAQAAADAALLGAGQLVVGGVFRAGRTPRRPRPARSGLDTVAGTPPSTGLPPATTRTWGRSASPGAGRGGAFARSSIGFCLTPPTCCRRWRIGRDDPPLPGPDPARAPQATSGRTVLTFLPLGRGEPDLTVLPPSPSPATTTGWSSSWTYDADLPRPPGLGRAWLDGALTGPG